MSSNSEDALINPDTTENASFVHFLQACKWSENDGLYLAQIYPLATFPQ